MGHELHFLELTELAQRLRRREVSAVEVTRARIGTLDGDLASFARVTPEHALAAAATADTEIATGGRCTACHSASRIYSARKACPPRQVWRSTEGSCRRTMPPL